MKIARHAFVFLLMLLPACATNQNRPLPASDPKEAPETVLISYHVKPAKETEMDQTLREVWKIYRAEHLVFKRPHVIIQDQENGGKPRIVEIFTWVNHSAPEHVPDSVKALWDRMQALCEARDGHSGLEGNEVELVAPQPDNSVFWVRPD